MWLAVAVAGLVVLGAVLWMLWPAAAPPPAEASGAPAVPDNAPVVATGASFSVDLAAFLTDAPAQTAADRLAAAGWPSFTWRLDGGRRHVLVGPYVSIEEAETAQAQLSRLGNPGARLHVDDRLRVTPAALSTTRRTPQYPAVVLVAAPGRLSFVFELADEPRSVSGQRVGATAFVVDRGTARHAGRDADVESAWRRQPRQPALTLPARPGPDDPAGRAHAAGNGRCVGAPAGPPGLCGRRPPRGRSHAGGRGADRVRLAARGHTHRASRPPRGRSRRRSRRRARTIPWLRTAPPRSRSWPGSRRFSRSCGRRSGSASPDVLAALSGTCADLEQALALVVVPASARATHGLLVSAVQLARTRHQPGVSGRSHGAAAGIGGAVLGREVASAGQASSSLPEPGGADRERQHTAGAHQRALQPAGAPTPQPSDQRRERGHGGNRAAAERGQIEQRLAAWTGAPAPE